MDSDDPDSLPMFQWVEIFCEKLGLECLQDRLRGVKFLTSSLDLDVGRVSRTVQDAGQS